VLTIDIGIDKADGQRLDLAAVFQDFQIPPQCAFIQFADHRAVGRHALICFYGQFQRRQKRFLDVADPTAQTTRTK
jgi:hypothetical protein